MTRMGAFGLWLTAASLAANIVANDVVIPLEHEVRFLAAQGSGQFLAASPLEIKRYNDDATLGTSLRVVTLGPLAVDNEERVLARSLFGLARIDLATGQGATIAEGVKAFALQPDGRIVVLAATFPNAPEPDTLSLSRLHPDGTPDATLSPSDFRGTLWSGLALQEDGKILASGGTNGLIARFNEDGSPDSTFHPPVILPPTVPSMVVQADGKILIAGRFTSPGPGLARLNADGSVDSAFQPAFQPLASVDHLALQANGKILISGPFPLIPGEGAQSVVRLNPDGTLDSSFALEGSSSGVSAPLILLADGSVLAALGTQLVRRENPDPAPQSLTRDGSTLTWQRGGSCPELFHAVFQASLDGVTWIDLDAAERVEGGWRLDHVTIPEGARLRARGYVAGTSWHVDYVPGAPALYSQPSDQTVNTGTNVSFQFSARGSEPLVIQWFQEGQPIAGANSATLLLTNVNGGLAGGYAAVVSNSEGSATSRVARLTVIDPILVTQPKSIWVNAGSVTNLAVAAIGTGLSYQWRKDGQILPGATSPTLTFSNATPAESGRYQAIVTGTYGTLESDIVTVRVNTAMPDSNFNPRWEATTQWAAVQSVVAHNNELFMGGLFRMAGAPGRDLVKLRADGSVDPLFSPELSGGEIGGVTALSLTPNGQLLVGGNFVNVNGQPQPRLARLNPDGTLDEQFRPMIEGVNNGLYSQVTSIETLPDGRILIGGGFTTVGGRDRPGLALLLPDGRLDETFDPDPAHVPGVTWGSFVQPSGRIIAYGWDLRRFHPNGAADLDFTEMSRPSGFHLLPLASGDLVITAPSETALGGVILTDEDGNPKPGVDPLPLEAAVQQADGRILGSRMDPIPLETPDGSLRFRDGGFLLRMSLEGTEDPGFSPFFDGGGVIKAMRADGSILLVGGFTNVAGVELPKTALLKNTEPATQMLTFDGSTAVWLRSGTSPAISRAVFEFSEDGFNWIQLGDGVRVDGGWQLEGLQLEGARKLRARGFFRGNIYQSAIDLAQGIKLGVASQSVHGSEVILTATASGAPRVILQASTDLREWSSVQTNLMEGKPWELTLTNQNGSHRFYRLLQTGGGGKSQ